MQIHGPDGHVCWPVSAQRISLSPPPLLSLSSLHLLMVSSHGLLLHYNRFHLPVKPLVRWRSETKDSESESEKESRRDFFSPIQTNLLPPLAPSQSPSSDLIKMLQSHFSRSVQDIIIQHDFWTASCTIRN